MLRYDKNGNAICERCGVYWDSHIIGGNCPQAPLSRSARETLRRIYKVRRKEMGGVTNVGIR